MQAGRGVLVNALPHGRHAVAALDPLHADSEPEEDTQRGGRTGCNSGVGGQRSMVPVSWLGREVHSLMAGRDPVNGPLAALSRNAACLPGRSQHEHKRAFGLSREHCLTFVGCMQPAACVYK